MKTVKTVFSFILSGILIFFLILLGFFASVQLNITSIFLTDVSAAEVSPKDFENILNGDKVFLHNVYDEEIIAAGYPPEILDYALENQTYLDVIETLKEDYKAYINGQGSMPTVKEEHIQTVLTESVQKYNETVPEEKKISSEQLSTITTFLTTQTNDAVQKLNQNKGFQLVTDFVYNKKYLNLCILGTIIIVVLLIILKGKSAYIYIATPLIIGGLLLGSIRLFMKYSFISSIENLLGNFYRSIYDNILLFTLSYCVLGGILIFIHIFTKKKKGRE